MVAGSTLGHVWLFFSLDVFSRAQLKKYRTIPHHGDSPESPYEVSSMKSSILSYNQNISNIRIRTWFVINSFFGVLCFRSHFPFGFVPPKSLYGFFGKRFKFGFLKNMINMMMSLYHLAFTTIFRIFS